jgi:aspartate racemase
MLGVLGGMGPQATADFLAKLVACTEAESDQQHLPVVAWSVPQIPDRTSAILHGGDSPLGPMLHGMRMLYALGAKAIAIPCNTAHYWYDALSTQAGLPILHIVDAAAEQISSSRPDARRLGLLGTEGTLRSGIYQKRLPAKFEVIEPNRVSMVGVMHGIAEVKAGHLDAARPLFEEAADALRRKGTDAILLACTEIPLAPPQGDDVFDVTDALARRCVTFFGKPLAKRFRGTIGSARSAISPLAVG